MNTALVIIGLAMFIFIVVFSLKRSKEKKETRNKDK
jgi:LPXTG-motif cell wall-anchored protein